MPKSVPKRRGKKIKTLTERAMCIFKPVQRVERSYSYEKKVQVLLFLEKHQVPINKITVGRPRKDAPTCDTPGYRPPTFHEAADFFKIPLEIIHKWWSQRDKLVNKELYRQYIPQWPDLEAELYKAFQTRRKMNKCVSVGWFRRESRSIFKQLYPAQENLFVFSSGWFIGFQKRHQISRRRVTKKATKVPAEYIDFVNKFLRFIKRVL